jgi:hypothetical protein
VKVNHLPQSWEKDNNELPIFTMKFLDKSI